VNTAASTDPELAVLSRIKEKATVGDGNIRQRDLARVAGMSLGMTNAILKRLARKGWVTVRRINSRNLQYAVSAAGVEEIARRSYRYVRRTIGHIARYKELIRELIHEAKNRGSGKIVLVGTSDIDFIIEHCCALEGMAFQRSTDSHQGPDTFVVFGEGNSIGDGETTSRREVHLRDILIAAGGVDARV